MATQSDLVQLKTRAPAAAVLLNGKPWRDVMKLSRSQQFGSGISTGVIEARTPPITPEIGMSISWTWGYGGAPLVAGFYGEVVDIIDRSYPDTWTLQVADVLYRADQVNQVIATDPLNEIAASTAVRQILTNYGGVPASRLAIPTLSASGSEWVGSEWILGTLTPVQWGDTETGTGGTTALKAAQEICGVLGYWLYADASGIVRAKQMERRPSSSALRTYQRGVDLLLQGAPERQQNVNSVYNQITVLGGNTGVDGAQITDQYQASHPLLPSGVYRNLDFSSFLIEYVNASEAGAASANSVARRLILVHSRIPNVVRYRAKADPRLAVGATVGIVDVGIRYTTAANFFLYQLDTSLDCRTGAFDDQLTLDGGTGSGGYTTIPNPDASFSWRLMAEGLDGDAVVEVFLDGSGSASLSGGEIVSWEWETTTPTYGSTPDTATGVNAVFVFLASAGTAEITLTVTDTTSKIGTITQTIDLTGADTLPPIERILSIAFGAAWKITPDGGVTIRSETSNGDAIAVGIYGAGIDGTAETYGLLATRGSAGAGGLRRTLDTLITPSTNLVSNAGAITSNIWVNEADPARAWFAIGTAVYRSTDGGATKTAMATAPASVSWIIEDAAVNDSVFIAAGPNLYHATAPTVGWALLYSGPVGSTARQFVRSRDGQVTWVCYTGTFTGGAAQRVENGAEADIAAAEIRTLALDKEASALAAVLYLIDADDPAAIYSVDGLTGLSATTYTSTLPAGATAMHMLGDPDTDLFYVADFDSVTTGTGAVRKFFPSADQLLLMLPGDTGEQAHMLGFGAAAPSPVTLYIPSWAGSGATDKLWKYTAQSGWVGLANPQTGWYWFGVLASVHNPDHLLIWGNTTSTNGVNGFDLDGTEVLADGTGVSPLWRSIDGGLNWTEVRLLTNTTRNDSAIHVAWSDSVAGEFYAAMLTDTSADEAFTIWRGSSAPLTGTTVTSGGNGRDLWGMCTGLGGDIVLDGTPGNVNPQNFGYVGAGASTFTPIGGDLDIDLFYLEPLPVPSPAVVARAGTVSPGNDIYATVDYRTDAPTNRITVSGGSLAAITEGIYVGDRTGVEKITDILGSPSSATEAATSGVSIGHIQAGRRERASLAARVSSTVNLVVYSGGVWVTVTGPGATTAAALSNWVEIAD